MGKVMEIFNALHNKYAAFSQTSGDILDLFVTIGAIVAIFTVCVLLPMLAIHSSNMKNLEMQRSWHQDVARVLTSHQHKEEDND